MCVGETCLKLQLSRQHHGTKLQLVSTLSLKINKNINSFEAILKRSNLAQSHFFKYLQAKTILINQGNRYQDQHSIISFMIKTIILLLRISSSKYANYLSIMLKIKIQLGTNGT